jgi:hypothetical protein
VVAAEVLSEREPGTVAQCFIPAMMYVRAIESPRLVVVSHLGAPVSPFWTANGSVDVEPQSLAAGALLRLLDGKRRGGPLSRRRDAFLHGVPERFPAVTARGATASSRWLG